MTGTFAERIDALKEMTGRSMTASVVVDQVYAHYQHERLELKHPRGGKAKYLEQPLYDNYGGYLREYAANVLRDGGRSSMKNAAEHLSDQVEITAPREFGDLLRSGHPSVTQAGHVIYDRPPKQHRLSEPELRAKARLRHLPPELIGWIWWHVMHKQEPPPHLKRR